MDCSFFSSSFRYHFIRHEFVLLWKRGERNFEIHETRLDEFGVDATNVGPIVGTNRMSKMVVKKIKDCRSFSRRKLDSSSGVSSLSSPLPSLRYYSVRHELEKK